MVGGLELGNFPAPNVPAKLSWLGEVTRDRSIERVPSERREYPCSPFFLLCVFAPLRESLPWPSQISILIKRSVARTLRSRRLPKPADGVMLRTDLKREGRGVRGEVFRPPRSPRAPRFHLLGLIHHRQAPDRGWQEDSTLGRI